jgi:hypothetical protein
MAITATGLISTSDSKYCLCRSTSAKRRAFWIATPTLAAIVASSPESASPKRPSSSMLWTLITPIVFSPTMIGTPRYERDGVPTRVAVSSSYCSDRLSRSGLPESMIWDVRPSPCSIEGSERGSPDSL